MPSTYLGEYRDRVEQLTQYRRTGEPSPSSEYSNELLKHLDWLNRFHERGKGKREDSFTETMRIALRNWIKEKNGGSSRILFKYRMSRHQTVVVSGKLASFKHEPLHGKGKRGFILSLREVSINGITCRPNAQSFSFNRILGVESFLMLSSGE